MIICNDNDTFHFIRRKQNAQSDPGGVLPVRHCHHFGRIHPPKMVEISPRPGGGGGGGGSGSGGGGGGIFSKKKMVSNCRYLLGSAVKLLAR